MSGTSLMTAQGMAAATSAGSAGGTSASTSASGAAVGTAPGGSAFDAILMLEEMVAAAGDIGVDAGAVELGAEGAEPGGKRSGDDEDNLELDDPLAFLAGLIAVVPRTPVPAAKTGESGGAAGGAVAGAEAAAAEAAAASGDDASIPFLTTSDSEAGQASTKDGGAEAAARALAAQTLASAVEAGSSDDKNGPSRAVDFLTHARGAASGVDSTPNSTAVATHVRDPRWADEFGTRIALLVNQRESVASISLTPVDMGPVDVSVTVRDSQATIHFGAAQADTRALIEASLPKLRELLAAQGFQLMDASVSQGFTRQSKQDAPSIPRPSSVDEVTPVASRTIEMNGLLDTYA